MPAYVNENFGNHSRRVLKKLREYREAEVYNMMVRCERQETIAKKLQISQGAVSMIVNSIREKSKAALHQYLTEHLPFAHSIALSGLDAVISELWSCYYDRTAGDLKPTEKASFLSLLADCYDQRLAMCGNGELVGEAMRQMDSIKHQLLELRPERAAELENRIASYQSGGFVTLQGELKQGVVLREQQQQQEKARTLNINPEIESNREDLNDESSETEKSSVVSSSSSTDTNLSQQNSDVLSLTDESSSRFPMTTDFSNGNGSNSSITEGQQKPGNSITRPTRNKVF